MARVGAPDATVDSEVFHQGQEQTSEASTVKECEPDNLVEALWSRTASSFQPAGSGGGKGLQSGGELSFLLCVLEYFNK